MGGKYSPYVWFNNSTLNDQAEGQKRDRNIFSGIRNFLTEFLNYPAVCASWRMV